jgi:hypothetical protein
MKTTYVFFLTFYDLNNITCEKKSQIDRLRIKKISYNSEKEIINFSSKFSYS